MTGRPACAALQTALLLLLLTTASCWGIGRQRPAVSKTAKPAKVEHVSTKATAHTLPPNTFLRVFALPSFEAKLAQVRNLPRIKRKPNHQPANAGQCGRQATRRQHLSWQFCVCHCNSSGHFCFWCLRTSP